MAIDTEKMALEIIALMNTWTIRATKEECAAEVKATLDRAILDEPTGDTASEG